MSNALASRLPTRAQRCSNSRPGHTIVKLAARRIGTGSRTRDSSRFMRQSNATSYKHHSLMHLRVEISAMRISVCYIWMVDAHDVRHP